MTLNKASLFQLTQNSQLNITVSVYVCTNVHAMDNVCIRTCTYTCIYVCICIHMTCVCMYVFNYMFVTSE